MYKRAMTEQTYKVLVRVDVKAENSRLACRVSGVAGNGVKARYLFLGSSFLGNGALLSLRGQPENDNVVWCSGRKHRGKGAYCFDTKRSLCLTCSGIPPPSTSMFSACAPGHQGRYPPG